MVERFRFMHVSDLHIGATAQRVGVVEIIHELPSFTLNMLTRTALATSHSTDMLRELLYFISGNNDRIEGLIITGDLSTTGEQGDLTAAEDALFPIPRLIQPDRIHFIPGNHDRLVGLALRPGGGAFDTTFQSYGWRGRHSATISGVVAKSSISLGIVTLDLSLRQISDIEPFKLGQIWGAGRAYKDVIDQACDLTNQLRRVYSPVGVVWLIHFPPQFPEANDSLRLIEDGVLCNGLKDCGPCVVLCGHRHQVQYYRIAPSTKVFCAGCATMYRLPGSLSPRTVHTLDISVHDNGVCDVDGHDYQWSENLVAWVAGGTWSL